jgi:hypothetical protein
MLTYDSEEHIASTFPVDKKSNMKQETSMLLSFLASSSTMKMEALRSSETPVDFHWPYLLPAPYWFLAWLTP